MARAGEQRRLVVFAALAASVAVAHPAAAGNVSDAEDLFRRGKAAMAASKPQEACPLFQESLRLDPQTGTLLNLALCDEAIGKIATAWGEFLAVEQQALAARPPREDRAELARERAKHLEPRLSRIKLVVRPEAKAPGTVVKFDGEERGGSSWASGVIVDVGTHRIDVSAPKKKSATVTVKIEDEATTKTVTLPPLEDGADPAGASGTSTVDLQKLERYAADRSRRTVGFAIGGVGLALVAAGATFGVLTIVANNDAHSCPSPCYAGDPAAQRSNDATDRAFVFANVANVLVPLGLVGAGIGTWIVLSTRKVSMTTTALPGGGAFRIGGGF